MNRRLKKHLANFVIKTRKPLFIAGIVFWVLVFFYLMIDSASFSATGHAISSVNPVFGIPGNIILIFFLIVLSVILFLVWKYVLKLKLKKKKKPEFIKVIF